MDKKNGRVKDLLELTPELKEMVKAVVHAMAWVETVRPVVIGYQTSILKEIGAADGEGNPIVTPERSYLLDEEKTGIYFSRCDEEAARNNLLHKPDCCPLLEAMSLEREAKRALVGHVLPLLPGFEMITPDRLQMLSKTRDGKLKRDRFGRLVNKEDELVELILKFTVPQIPENELKNL